jgi:hypothetical protein
MSVETSRTSQPGDSDDEQTYGYRSADSAAVNDDLDDDDLDDDAVSTDDDLEDEDDAVVVGTVVDEDADDEDAVVTEPDAVADPDAVAYSDAAADADDPRPTFTPVDDGPIDSSPLDSASDYAAPTLSETDDVPVVPAAADAPVTDAPFADTAAAEAPLSSATDIDPNAPLLGDSVSLRANWQQAQAGFVDDPRAAVADAAELVEHAAQTLIGSLQQRQVALRNQWDNNGSGATAPSTTGELSDTEQLRHLMQDYRNLFNQLVQP